MGSASVVLMRLTKRSDDSATPPRFMGGLLDRDRFLDDCCCLGGVFEVDREADEDEPEEDERDLEEEDERLLRRPGDRRLW